MHAGNLAYMLLVTLLPLVILVTAVAGALGRTGAGKSVVSALITSLPPNLQELFGPVIHHVVEARTGVLLWVGGVVALWTVSAFVGSLRQVVNDAYRAEEVGGFVGTRLRSMLGTLAAMVLVVLAFLVLLLFMIFLRSVVSIFPYADRLLALVDVSRIVSFVFVFFALWGILKILSPRAWRRFAAWPGALVTSSVWVGGTFLLEPILSRFANMDLTYGALSGVMVAMLFFHVVGFAFVYGAELNAALSRRDRETNDVPETME